MATTKTTTGRIPSGGGAKPNGAGGGVAAQAAKRYRIDPDDTVDVVALLDRIDFSPEDVVGAASVNPVLYVESIKYRLTCMQVKSAAKMECKRLKAETEMEIRNAAKARDEKLTEAMVAAKLSLDDDVIAVENALEAAESFDEYSKLVVDAFRMRRDCLQIVGNMMRAEMGVGRALESEVEALAATRKKLEDKFPGR